MTISALYALATLTGCGLEQTNPEDTGDTGDKSSLEGNHTETAISIDGDTVPDLQSALENVVCDGGTIYVPYGEKVEGISNLTDAAQNCVGGVFKNLTITSEDIENQSTINIRNYGDNMVDGHVTMIDASGGHSLQINDIKLVHESNADYTSTGV